jgi:predicted Zn-ribbon and HTH transcriptional regulator
VVFRKQLIDLLSTEPRSVSRIARELGIDRKDAAEDLEHALRSAQSAGHRVVIEPAVCRSCGFVFEIRKLTKPSKCPQCRGTRVLEAQIRIDRSD